MRRWSLLISAAMYGIAAIVLFVYSLSSPILALLALVLGVPFCIAHATTFMYVSRKIDEEEAAADQQPTSSSPGVEGTPWARNPGHTRDGKA